MCGICGYISDHPDYREPALGARLLDALRARGPDQQGSLRFGSVWLGCARLSIMDPEGGEQPFVSEDGRVAAVYNGEIFNHHELRAALLAEGHVLRSRCDGEVLVHAYETWGESFVERLDGMFAIALWDERQRRLLLYRDLFGIKPLYTCESPRGFFFASEIKCLRRLPGLDFSLDRQSLGAYLLQEYVPAPRTIYREVRKLPPAHRLAVEGARVRVERYWRLAPRHAPRLTRHEAAAEVERLLRRSVQRQMKADAPVGVLLSGGIDSSLVAALAAREARVLSTFTLGFDEASFDERSHAALAARHVGAEGHLGILTAKDAPALLDETAACYDEPIGDASVLPTFLLCRLARREVKVVLTGDGGDELFAGYPTYLAHQWSPLFLLLPEPWRRRLLLPLCRWLPVSHESFSLDFKVRTFLERLHPQLVTRHLQWMGSFTLDELSTFLAEPVRIEEQALHARYLEHVPSLLEERAPDAARRLDLVSYLPDDLLYKMDFASMAHGLEARPPFLDRELVELAFGLPLAYHLRRGQTKTLLRRVASRHLPRALVGRKKKGFGVPVAEWLIGPHRDGLLRWLDPKRIERVGLLQPGPVRRLVEEHLSRRCNHRKRLWTLIFLQCWAEHHGLA